MLANRNGSVSRFKAAGIHLLISGCIVITVLTTMYFLWYPSEYFTLMGGKKLIMVLASVDVFLGPLLTLCIFKGGKKGLKFDLICIGLVQLAALSYGIYVMFQARPVFTVFNKNQFQISAVVEISPDELAKAKKTKWKKLSVTGPELVGIGIPNKQNKREYMFAMVVGTKAYRYPSLYEDYNEHRSEVIKVGRSLSELSADSSENKASIDKFLDQVKRPATDFLVLPISSELAEMSAIVDAKTGDFIEIIDAKPKVVSHQK